MPTENAIQNDALEAVETFRLPSGESAAAAEGGLGFYVGFGPLGQGTWISAADVREMAARLPKS